MDGWIVVTFILFFVQNASAYRILAVVPFSGKSHYIQIKPIIEELVSRGHHVTSIASYAEKSSNPKYKQITVDKRMIWEYYGHQSAQVSLESITAEDMVNLALGGILLTSEAALNSTDLQDFIKNDDSHYDLILAQILYQECFYMFAHKYKAPIVGIHTMGFSNYVGYSVGNPLILSYMTHEFLSYGQKLSVFEKIRNVYVTLYDIFMRKKFMARHQALAEKYFKHLPRPLPAIGDIEKNISIIFVNTHYSYDTVRPYVPGVVEVGGIHIKKPKDLPTDIKFFLDDSIHGAIFFSFGSNIQSDEMPPEKVQIFLNVFKNLTQRVVWKWETENLQGKPDNVMVGKWLPQNDILAHPNVKAFITHGGLLSTQEAIHHGVPILGIPFFADQFLNIEKMQERGLGLRRKFSTLSEEELKSALNMILEDPKFYKKSKEYSLRFRDRQNSPMDSMIFWMEYVIRHKGADFIKSPVLNLSFVEYYMLDILFVLLIFLLIFLGFLWFLIKIVLYLIKFVKKDFQSEKVTCSKEE